MEFYTFMCVKPEFRRRHALFFYYFLKNASFKSFRNTVTIFYTFNSEVLQEYLILEIVLKEFYILEDVDDIFTNV